MVPRQRQLAFFLVRLFSMGLFACLLTGCDSSTPVEPRPPAVTVPHGELVLDSQEVRITPRARAVELLSERAAKAGLQTHTLAGVEGPLALLIEIDLRQFEPVLLSAPQGIATRGRTARLYPHSGHHQQHRGNKPCRSPVQGAASLAVAARSLSFRAAGRTRHRGSRQA